MQLQSTHFAQQQSSPSISLADAYEAWTLDLQARRCTPATLTHYREFLLPFVRWLEHQQLETIAQITPTHLRRFLTDLQARNLAGYTILGYYRDIRAWLRFCVAEGWLAESPAARVRPPKLDKTLLPAFTEDEVRWLLGGCEIARDRALVLFLLDTGVRAKELVNLQGDDLDMREGSARIRSGKGRKDRVVYLGAQTRKALLRYYAEVGKPAAGEPLWPSLHSGDPLTTSGLRQLLRRLGRRARVPNVHPHTFRRTFALWSLRAGMNIYALQRLMGHEDLTVLRRYLALVEEDLRDAHARAGTVDNMLGGRAVFRSAR
jgi:integrase/recombinase XerD